MNKKVIIILFLFACGVIYAQQQTVFTNINLHPYLYNPAFAGSTQGLQFNAGYRNQWAGFEGAPKTIVASGYGTFKKKTNMAAGGLIINDKSGLLQRTSFYGTYSYHVKLGKKANLGFGLAFGGVQYNVKIYNAKPYDKDDEFLKNNILNANAFDANSGLYLYGKKFFLGISNNQMINGKIYWPNTNGRLVPHLYVNSGYNFILDKKKKEWAIQPSVLLRFNNPVPFQIEGNLKLMYKDMVWIGASYRHKSAACFLVGATISKQFTFGYSYDYSTTALQQYSTGSHELVLSYTILAKKKKTASEKVLDADESEFNNIDNSMKANLKNKKKEEEKNEEKK